MFHRSLGLLIPPFKISHLSAARPELGSSSVTPHTRIMDCSPRWPLNNWTALEVTWTNITSVRWSRSNFGPRSNVAVLMNSSKWEKTHWIDLYTLNTAYVSKCSKGLIHYTRLRLPSVLTPTPNWCSPTHQCNVYGILKPNLGEVSQRTLNKCLRL